MKVILLLSLLLWANVTLGSDEKLDKALSLAQEKQLYAHPTWLKLLHYERGRLISSDLRSAIISHDFFIAKEGQKDPKAELEATILAMLSPIQNDPNSHPQCRFRGRYQWLKQMQVIGNETDISCPDFEKFTAGNSISSISIVLATGYLGNPASFYGHTLLKLNSHQVSKKANLLDESVNYGAIIPKNTNPVSYIFNGVFGGYDAGFTSIQYYFHTHNYGENELRDLWEYELNLTQDEIDLIVSHAWEVLGKRYRYYFFRRNCAYRMGELIEIASGVDIIPNNYAYTIPQTLIKNIGQATRKNGDLLKDVTYYPSRQSRLYEKFTDLNKTERKLVRQLARNTDWLESDEYQKRPVASKQKIIDTLLDYYQFLQANDSKVDSKSPSYLSFLKERYKLPPGRKNNTTRKVDPISPDKGRNPSLVSIGGYNNSKTSNGASIRIRPAYYDALDAGAGHVSNGQLTMADLQVDINSGQVRLHHFDIFAVESVSPSTTLLPGDDGKSWRLKLGVEKQNLSCKYCLVTRVQGDVGIAFPVTNSIFAGLLAGGIIQENKHDEGHGVIRATAFVQGSYEAYSARLQVEARNHLDGRLKQENVVLLEAQYQLKKNHAIRLGIEKNVSTEARLSYGYYW